MVRRSVTALAAFTVFVGALSGARLAEAGPPLLCHPFDIAASESLPWDGSRGWWQGRSDYPLANLVADTEALLAPDTPVVVRMETIRRAAIYASQDRQVATALLNRLKERVRVSETPGNRPDPLALLDAGYLVETFRQIGQLYDFSPFRERTPIARAVAGEANGYAMIKKSLTMRPGDPSLQFAAALAAAGRDRAASQEHARKARAGASGDALLARNIGQLGS